MTTINDVKKIAATFLTLADSLNEKVSAYFNGSDDKEDEAAYNLVKSWSNKLADAVNDCDGENDYNHDGLHYELAESVLYA